MRGWVYFHLTRIGWVHSAATLILGLVAVASAHNLVYLLFGVAVGTTLIHGMFGWRNLRRLTVRRHMPASAVVGSEVQIRYEVRVRDEKPNGAHRARWSLRMVERGSVLFTPHEPAAFILRMAGGIAHGVCTIQPKQRGLLALDRFTLRSRFPFGLGDRYIRFSQPRMLLVWPRMGWLSGQLFERVASSRTMWNRRERRGRGQDEFYGLRDYRDGDNPRWIHWRTTARRGELVVREFEAQQSGHIALMVDTLADLGDADAVARRELAISLTATAARDATRLGYEVSLVACDDRVHSVRPGRGVGHLGRILNCLALLGDNPGKPLRQILGECDAAVLRGAYGIAVGTSSGLAGLHVHRLRPLMAAVSVLDVTDPMLGRIFRLDEPPVVGKGGQ